MYIRTEPFLCVTGFSVQVLGNDLSPRPEMVRRVRPLLIVFRVLKREGRAWRKEENERNEKNRGDRRERF